MLESLVDDLFGQLADAVAAGRKLDPAAARDVLGRGPYVAAEAQAAGLIDCDRLCGRGGGAWSRRAAAPPTIERDAYARRRGREMRLDSAAPRRATPFALLHIGGTIKPGESVTRPDGARRHRLGDRSRRRLKTGAQARRHRRAGAAHRQPGRLGAGVGPDLARAERTRATKPVIVSCGDVAASGGYYVALAGRPLLAEAGTITGSIGVIAGKATLRGLYDRLGVRKETDRRAGSNAALYSDYVPLDDEGRARIQHQADVVLPRLRRQGGRARAG